MSKAIGHELRAAAMSEGFEYAYLRSLESKSRASRPSDAKSRVEAIVGDVMFTGTINSIVGRRVKDTASSWGRTERTGRTW